MRPVEFCEVDDALCFKRKNESFYFPVIFARTSEIKIKGEEASSSLEESYDKEKRKLVIQRMAFETGRAPLLRLGVKVLRTSGGSKHPG